MVMSPLQICMLGSGNVGKSALTLQFMYDEFVEDYEPTKSDSYVKSITLNGIQLSVSILDTAGQESYYGLLDSIYRKGEGFVIVFSLTDVESFNAAKEYIDRFSMITFSSNCVPKVLVGNKADLENQREVSIEKAQSLADSCSMVYIETSAKTNMNVQQVFQHIANEIYKCKVSVSTPVKTADAVNENKCCYIL